MLSFSRRSDRQLSPCDLPALIDQALEYLKRLQDADVQVEYRIFRGMPHDFLFFDYEESYSAYAWISEQIRALRN